MISDLTKMEPNVHNGDVSMVKGAANLQRVNAPSQESLPVNLSNHNASNLPPPPPLPLPPHPNGSQDGFMSHSLPELRAPEPFAGDMSSHRKSTDLSQGSNMHLHMDVREKRLHYRKHAKSSTCNMVSGLYGKLVIVATAVLVMTEVMENNVPLLFFHGYLYAFLLGGAVVCLMGVYISMMVDKCPSLTGSPSSSDSSLDHAAHELTGKKRAMISCTDISIYLRVGVLVFGLGTLISSGLEIATIFTIPHPCTDPVNLAMPVLHAFFTFLQMHFLFMNSQRVVHSLGCIRHMAFMHLVAANVAVWLRLLLWDTSSEWLKQRHVFQTDDSSWPPKGFNYTAHVIDTKGDHKIMFTRDCLWEVSSHERMEKMLTLQKCLQNSTIGAIWNKAMPFLTPFIVQYSIVAAAIIYTLWDNFAYCSRVSRERKCIHRLEAEGHAGKGTTKIMDCQGSSKGLFMGLLVLVAGIIVLILFFVLSNENMEAETLSAVVTLHCAIQGLSAIATLVGICRIRCMSPRMGKMTQLNSLLQGIGILAVYAYGIFSIVVGASKLWDPEHILLLCDGSFMVLQAGLQSIFIQEIACRGAKRDKHHGNRPGLQIVTFLMFSNLVLWLLETFTNQNHISSQHQLTMFGAISWGIISRVTLPLVIFYRFHSCVVLMESWRSSTTTRKD